MNRTALLALIALTAPALAADLVVDCGNELPRLKRINGVNCGPIEQQGLVDLTAHHKAMRFPLTRLHDCNWPNPDVVDVHAVFPNFGADADRPDSYDFLRTDEYLRSVLATGSQVVYRLGESIELGKDKRRCQPPADVDKWARVCLNIVRHYNDGWANGFKHGIAYWEIWNEPENRPACWTGTDEDYYRLYVATAKALKAAYPDLKVGGPSVGNVAAVRAGTLTPTPFVTGVLDRCKKDGAPLDFFSWHWYGTTPADHAARARAVRRMLDDAGFARAESHLNEWNYLPGNDWTPNMPRGQGLPRRRFAERMAGIDAAAFTAATLIAIADEPVDVANFYAGNALGFGLFDVNGVPRQSVGTFKAFAAVAELPVRVEATGPVAALAAKGDAEVRVLLAAQAGKAAAGEVTLVLRNLPWAGETTVSEARVDESVAMKGAQIGKLSDGRITLTLRPPAVSLLTIRPARR
jgi:hypothetical protein